MSTAKSRAREVILQHLHAFPDDMNAAQCLLQKHLGVTDSIVFASFQRLEFEIEAIRAAVTAERDECCKLVYGHAVSDNCAERTVRAIRNRKI
jgi:hypothetical protein